MGSLVSSMRLALQTSFLLAASDRFLGQAAPRDRARSEPNMAVIALARLPSLAGGSATPFWDGIPDAGRFAVDPFFNFIGQHDGTIGMSSLVP